MQVGQAKRLLQLTTGRVLMVFIAVATTRVMTQLLAPAEMGRYAQLTSFLSIFSLMLISPVGMFVNRRLHAWRESGTLSERLSQYSAYVTAVGALVVGVASAVPLLAHGLGGMLPLLLSAYLCISTVNTTLIPALNLLGFSGVFITLTVATELATLCAASALCVWHPTAARWITGQLLGFAVIFVSASLVSHRVLGLTFARPRLPVASTLRRVWVFCWPLGAAVGAAWLQQQSYRLSWTRHDSLAHLGLFVAGYGVSAAIMASFEQLLTQYLQPAFYALVNSGAPHAREQAWARYAKVALPCIVLTFGLIALVAPVLVKVLLGPRYGSSVAFVLWGAAVESLRVASAVYAMAAQANMSNLRLVLPSVGGAAVAVALVPLLARNGPVGVCYALLLAALAKGIGLHIAMSREIPLNVPWVRLAASAAATVPLLACRRLAGGAGLQSIALCMAGGAYWAVVILRLLREGVGEQQPERGGRSV